MTLLDLVILISGAGCGAACGVMAGRFGAQSDRGMIIAGALAGTALSAAALRFAPGGNLGLGLTLLLGWLLLALALIDLRTFRLPDALNAAVLLLGAVMVALLNPAAWPWHLAGAVAGYGLLVTVELSYRRLRGIDGLGRGDAKLLGALGAWVGLAGIPPVLLVASLSALVATLALALLGRQPISAQTAIAFGPWIAFGGYAVWLFTPLAQA